MKLRLTPKGTLWPSLVMASMSAIFLPGTLMASRGLDHVDHVESVLGQGHNTPSIGVVSLALFLMGCMGPMLNPAMFSIRTRATDFEASLPVTRLRVLMERCCRLWLALGTPVLVATVWMAGAQMAAFSIWESLVDMAWPARLFLWPPILALVGHAALALTIHAYRPWKDELTALDLLALAVIAPILIVLPFVLLPELSFVPHAIIGAVAILLMRIGSKRKSEATNRTRPRSRSDSEVDPVHPSRWQLSQTHRVLLKSTVLRPSVVRGLFAILALTLVAAYFEFDTGMLFAVVLSITLTATPSMANLLEGTDPLPIRRARVLPWLVGPSLGAIVFLSATASLSETDSPYQEGPPRTQAVLDWNYGTQSPELEVPPRLWRRSEVQGRRRVEAPWGEVTECTPVLIFGRPTGVYNPYSVGSKNTVRFARWQISRASAAAGKELTDDEVKRSVLPDLDPTTSLWDARSDLSGSSPFELPKQPWRRRVVGLDLLLAVMVWGGLTRVALRSRKPRRGVVALTQTSFARNVGFMASMGCLMWVGMMPAEWARTSYHVAEFWLDRQLSGSSLAWYALTLATIALMYGWILRAFWRTETPQQWNPGWGQREIPIF